MVLNLQYKQKIFPCGLLFWVALVKCDRCGKERMVSSANVKKGVGVKWCKKCAFIGENNPFFGKCHTEVVRKHLSEQKVGANHPFYGKHLSAEHRIKIGLKQIGEKNHMFGKHHSEEHCRRIGDAQRGSKNHSWNPELTDGDREHRRSLNKTQLQEWRKTIFARDHFTCQILGHKGCNLNVHHLFSYHKYKDRRFDIHNGITIRRDVHLLFHMIYGQKNNTPDQFFEFCEYMYDVLRM